MIRVGGMRAGVRKTERGGDGGRQVRAGTVQLITDPINPWACCTIYTPVVVNLRPVLQAVCPKTFRYFCGKLWLNATPVRLKETIL
jgi:hypothetical protein